MPDLVIPARAFALHLEGFGESRFVDHEPVFLRQVLDDFQRQPASVVQEERLFAGQRAAARGFDLPDAFVEILQSLAQSAREGVLFLLDDARDGFPRLNKFGIGSFHDFHHGPRYAVYEGLVDSQPLSVDHGAPHDFSQDISALVVAGVLAVAYDEGGRARMIGNNAHRDIIVGIRPVIGV